MTESNAAPKLYFDCNSGGYWLQLSSARFLCLQTSQAKLHLRWAGLNAGKFDLGLSEVETKLFEAMRDRYVDYAGPLAGHRCGLFTHGGCRVLVTSEPAPEVFNRACDNGDFPTVQRFLEQLFGVEQLPYVLAWLKCARLSLRLGDFRPGQLLVLAGPSNVGKSLFQALVTQFLGGRVAKPYRYMSGQTPFNADLAGAEHLSIEDEHASTDIRSRRKFGASLKDFSVNRDLSIHGKFHQAITLPTFKRVTLSVNSEPENLMILPPLDESIMDKILLCKCSKAEVGEDRNKLWSTLTAELSYFAASLEAWRVPAKIRDSRFGVLGYANPELLDLVSEIAPETRLCNLIDAICFKGAKQEFQGSAEELENELMGDRAFGFQVSKLLYFSSACGVYLSRLAVKYPTRFRAVKQGGKTLWTISAA